MTGVSSDKMDMLVYICASQSQKRRVLSPTSLDLVSTDSDYLTVDVRLVVTLRVGNGLLAMPPVCQGKDKLAHVPVDILLLLQPLDVEVRHSHG